MQKFVALFLLVALAAAVPQTLNDLTGRYSLWRPPTWPNYETCCYLQGANITLTADIFSMQSFVMGPCAQYLPGTNGLASMTINGKISDLASGVNASMKFYTTSGVHTQDRTYKVVYSVERTPAPVDILTFTQVGDSNCTFELRNDTSLFQPKQQSITTFFQKFLAKLEKVQDRLDVFFTKTAADFSGKFSLWRPPTWQNFSQCCYLQGANVTYDSTAKQFNYQAVVMGPCAGLQNLPGTNGTMTAKLTAGAFADNTFTIASSFYVKGSHTADKTFTVTATVELTPAPVDVYIYHAVDDKADTSCDFKLRKDTN